MIIAICVLAGLLAVSVFLNCAMWYAIGQVLDKNPQQTMNYFFENETEERFPCSLLLCVKEGAEFDGSVFDFSEYEEKGIIGLTEFRKASSNGHFTDQDGEPKTAILPNQIVCKMKDGSHQWDFRRLM